MKNERREMVKGDMVIYHLIFRLIIAVFICIGLYGTITLSQDAIDRFNTNPTVVSMDRNMFFWNTSFPSLTICLHKKLSDIKLAEYVE